MKLPKKIIAVISCIAITISCMLTPVSAAGIGEIIGVVFSTVEFLDWGLNKIEDWQTANPDKEISEYPGYNPGGMFDLGFGASRGDMESAYNTYVSDLQTDLGSSVFSNVGSQSGFLYALPITSITNNGIGATKYEESISEDRTSFTLDFVQNVAGAIFVSYDSFTFPFDCRYYKGFDVTQSYNAQWGFNNFNGEDFVFIDYGLASAGSSASSSSIMFRDVTLQLTSSFGGVFYLFLVPVDLSSVTTQNITINSRPTSITGDYGILGDNGTITKVDGNVIVDESTSTVYNPVTNTTTNFTNWSYDYSDRSYNLTTEAGDTITVTYGDENITINEGDTIYNVYYVIPQEQPSDPGTDPGTDHTHTYTDEITKQPTCLLSGVRTYTCSCGDSYTKTVPATGHDWQISQQVPNTYDPETGEQTQAGYTVYTCATCGEQYKSTDGTAPPNSSAADDSSGGIGGVLSGLLGAVGDVIAGLIEGALTLATKAMEALTGLGDLVSQMIETVLGFFGGFIDFMAAMFPFLPEETFTILNLGLILMIAAAVFRKFLN